jgi:hypothetical protein
MLMDPNNQGQLKPPFDFRFWPCERGISKIFIIKFVVSTYHLKKA